MIILLTGQPNSGKTTIGTQLRDIACRAQYDTILIDGDKLREWTGNADYTEAGRRKNIESAFAIAMALDGYETVIIIALVAPYRELREHLKAYGAVLEVYLHTTRKHAVKDTRRSNYEPPESNFIDVDTDQPLAECVETIANEVSRMLSSLCTHPIVRGGL